MRTFLGVLSVIAMLSAAPFAFGQIQGVNTERFDRQLEQIRRDTDARALSNVPTEQRALLDYGGFLSFNYFSIDDQTNDTHILRQYEIVGFARLNLDNAQELYLRGRAGYQDFNDGDSFDGEGDEAIQPQLDRGFYRFDLNAWQKSHGQGQSDLNLVAKGGRDLVYWGNGLVISQVIDGMELSLLRGDNDLTMIAGVTPRRTIDIDVNRPHFDDNTLRGFYGAILSHQIGQSRPFIYGLIQRDYNSDDESFIGGVTTRYDYNSYYIGVGSNGAITDKLLYGVELTYQGGNTLSNSFTIVGATVQQIEQTRDYISAWGGDARIDYLLLDQRKTRLSAEIIAGSGDSDRFSSSSSTFGGNKPNTPDHAFNAFGLINTGLSFAPQVSNLLALRVGAVTFPLPDMHPFNRLQFGADMFFFAKMNQDAPVEEATKDKAYLGCEPNAFINWQISSDVTIAIRYGCFFPGAGIIQDEKSRQFFGAGITYAF